MTRLVSTVFLHFECPNCGNIKNIAIAGLEDIISSIRKGWPKCERCKIELPLVSSKTGEHVFRRL